MMKKVQQGFTLIELMIVVAIIGILAALAIPAYQDYITRAQVTEAIELLSGFKTPVSEFMADKGKWPSTVGSVGSTSSIEGTMSGKYATVQNSVIGTAGNAAGGANGAGQTGGIYVLDAKMNTGRAANTYLSIGTDGNGSWVCGEALDSGTTGVATIVNARTTVLAKYLPAACKP
jgi:type IV pilus assembly protein PilA